MLEEGLATRHEHEMTKLEPKEPTQTDHTQMVQFGLELAKITEQNIVDLNLADFYR